MDRLIEISAIEDVPRAYQYTPIAKLVEFHNLRRASAPYETAELLIGTCIDFRIGLRFPEKFAFVFRTGGANLQKSEFELSFAIAIRHLKYMVVVGHNDCGMCGLEKNKAPFVDGLVKVAGWDRAKAEQLFIDKAPLCEIGDEITFVLGQVKRLRKQFPALTIAPMFYHVDKGRLYFIRES